MISVARNRLQQELREFRKDPDPDIGFEPDESAFESTTYHAHVTGPRETPYEGGCFQLRIEIPPSYPLSAPKVWFRTKCFHPNVHFGTGELCLDVLKTDWSPVWGLRAILRAIIALLVDPNADSPLNCDAGNLIRGGDMLGFRTMARMYTLEYAMASTSAATSNSGGGEAGAQPGAGGRSAAEIDNGVATAAGPMKTSK